jgi:P-type Mg2+ transporter
LPSVARRKASLSRHGEAAEGAALPADDVLARLGSGTPGLPGDEAARRLQVVGPNAVRSHRVHALSVLASQLRFPQLMLLAVTVMAVVDQIEITG